MIPPELIGGLTVVAIVVAAGAYARYTGGSAAVDLDDREIEFEGRPEPKVDATPPDDSTDQGIDTSKLDTSPTPYRAAERTEFDDVGSGSSQSDSASQSREHVDEYDGLTDVDGIGPTKAERLGNAGFDGPKDVYYASDDNLLDVKGIGESVLQQIRSDIGSFDDESE